MKFLYNLKHKVRFSLMCASLLTNLLNLTQSVFAQRLEEELPYTRDPVAQWIAVVEDDSMRLVPADLEKTPNILKLSTFLRGLREDALVSGVALLVDGEVIATPFHGPWHSEFEGSSISVAKSQAEDLTKRIELANARLKVLEGDIMVATAKLRRESGLSEVDELYDKASLFEERAREINLASERLDKMILESQEAPIQGP